MPDIPTSDEGGVPGLYMSGWFGFFAPKSTPRDIIDKLNSAMVQVLADPDQPPLSGPGGMLV
jgi:tripartite-type tricarboxylate transporter receptor subunit TctC